MNATSRFTKSISLIIVMAVLVALFAGPAQPALAQTGGTCIVTSPADDGGAGTLRYILGATRCETITFDGNYTIVLDSAQGSLNILRSVTIDGAGHDVTLSGGGLVRVLAVAYATTFNLQNLSVVNGRADFSQDGYCGGGGMMIAPATVNISNVTFSGNQQVGVPPDNSGTLNSCMGGGGILNLYGSLTLTDVTFDHNSADMWGGGLHSYGFQGPIAYGGAITLTRVSFLNNTGDFAGGGMASLDDARLTLTDVTFSGNSAPGRPGYASASGFAGGLLIAVLQPAPMNTPTLTNVIFSGNTAAKYGGLYVQSPAATLTNVIFDGNSALGAQDQSTRWAGAGGGMGVYGSATLTNATFSHNSAADGTSQPGEGGGMHVENSSATLLTNVTFSGNSAGSGGAIEHEAIYTLNSSLTVRNSILWGNGDNAIHAGGFGEVLTTVSYSDVEGGWTGTGNIDADPLFVDATNGDLHLQTGSPAVNAGDQTLLPADGADLDGDDDTAEPIPYDLDGSPRVVGGQVDMGAYEFVPNEPPVANPGGPYLGAINTPIQFDGSTSSDPDGDTLTYAWAFGDGGTSTEAAPSHSYAAAGIYNVCLTVNDGTVDSAPACTMAVVYDPSGGFVTGGGWIMSPAGAYVADPALEGKATFGFVSKYQKGATVPTGNTEFQFQVAGLNFESTSYEWLVVAGAHAKYKGVGTINGAGNYGFMLTATDGSPDTFRIKIWDKDNGDSVVYDNQMGEGDDSYAGTALGGGSIVVHTK